MVFAALLLSALLDVPFLAQPPELCGGAAVSMVMRYWGGRDVFPQDFAPALSPGAGGIVTAALAASVRDRGWQAHVLPAPDDTGHGAIAAELDQGRPLIALIEVGPRTYHYVVIVGATTDVIVVHDPARAPFRVLTWSEFDRAWSATGRWMMLVLPGTTPKAAPAPLPAAATASAATPCTPMIDRAIQLAADHEPVEAERALTAAIALCPRDPAPLRELAGLRFTQRRYAESESLGLAAVRIADDDPYAWQVIATSRYMMERRLSALRAWNLAGEPHIDQITILGLSRTPLPVVMTAAALAPRALLTPGALTRAERRVDALPVVSAARVSYEPAAAGVANVTVNVVERPLAPGGWTTFAVTAARAATARTTTVSVAGLLGAGELARLMWRWAPNRPRVELGLSVPSPPWLAGIVDVTTSWERQSYPTVTHERRRSSVSVSDWAPGGQWRWSVGAALDAFDGVSHGSFNGGIEWRPSSDRMTLRTTAGWWAPFRRGDRVVAADVLAAVRASGPRLALPRWSVISQFARVSEAAPLALWHGAGTGQGRSGLLRSHALLDQGVLTGPLFGRTVQWTTAEYTHPLPDVVAKRALSLAVFTDGARAWRRVDQQGASRWYEDAGAGLRVQMPGQRGWLRVDLAHGLRGGGLKFSAGLVAGWPQ